MDLTCFSVYELASNFLEHRSQASSFKHCLGRKQLFIKDFRGTELKFKFSRKPVKVPGHGSDVVCLIESDQDKLQCLNSLQFQAQV